MTLSKYRGKRLLDVVGAVFLLLVSLPVLALVALAVRVGLGSPVLFRQRRAGALGRQFDILKFRTMTDARDSTGELRPDAERLTALGRFLRASSLDELPELWNVLKGEMSLVGPRPLLIEYLPFYSDRERQRFLVRPGITGLAQVSGRNLVRWDQRLELDVTYVESMSFATDLAILARTVSIVLFQHGVATDVDTVETRLDEERRVRINSNGTEVSERRTT